MKKVFLALVAVFVLASATISVKAAVNGDHLTAAKFGLVAFTGAVATSSATSGALGLFGSPGLAALERNAGRFGTKTREQFTNIEAIDHTLYVRREITSKNGVYRLIEASNIKTAGITNIDKNKLPEGDNFAIESIWIGEGNHATQTNPAAIANYTNVATSIQAELLNAELVISQNTKEKLRLPMSALMVMAVNSNGSKKDTAYTLRDNPVVLVENEPFEINVEFPAAMATQSTSTNKFHLAVELHGKKTQKRVA